jgi:hypothetical protein
VCLFGRGRSHSGMQICCRLWQARLCGWAEHQGWMQYSAVYHSPEGNTTAQHRTAQLRAAACRGQSSTARQPLASTQHSTARHSAAQTSSVRFRRVLRRHRCSTGGVAHGQASRAGHSISWRQRAPLLAGPPKDKCLPQVATLTSRQGVTGHSSKWALGCHCEQVLGPDPLLPWDSGQYYH